MEISKNNDDISILILSIIEILDRNKESYYSKMLSQLLYAKKNKNEEEFLQDLNSNDLWGGSGSLADSVLNQHDVSETDVICFNVLMTKLGKYVIKNLPNSNRRIPFWINTEE